MNWIVISFFERIEEFLMKEGIDFEYKEEIPEPNKPVQFIIFKLKRNDHTYGNKMPIELLFTKYHFKNDKTFAYINLTHFLISDFYKSKLMKELK